jgi:hypothetical protein
MGEGLSVEKILTVPKAGAESARNVLALEARVAAKAVEATSWLASQALHTLQRPFARSEDVEQRFDELQVPSAQRETVRLLMSDSDRVRRLPVVESCAATLLYQIGHDAAANGHGDSRAASDPAERFKEILGGTLGIPEQQMNHILTLELPRRELEHLTQ